MAKKWPAATRSIAVGNNGRLEGEGSDSRNTIRKEGDRGCMENHSFHCWLCLPFFKVTHPTVITFLADHISLLIKSPAGGAMVYTLLIQSCELVEHIPEQSSYPGAEYVFARHSGWLQTECAGIHSANVIKLANAGQSLSESRNSSIFAVYSPKPQRST